MQITTDGLVLRENSVKENDRIITVLTRDCGVLHAYSVGARKVKSKKNASTSLLAYSKFSFSGNEDKLRVDDAVPIEMFFELRGDILKISVAQYFCELLQALAPIEENTEDYLRLALNSLHLLSKNDINPHLIKAIFELRIMTLSGYQPDLTACADCGEFQKDKLFLDISNGVILCGDCIDGEAAGLTPLDKSVLAAMRHIVYSDFSKLFSFSLGAENTKILSNITEKYLCDKTERSYKSLDFLHSVDI